MWHPFLNLSPTALHWWVIVLVMAAGFGLVGLQSSSRRLRTAAAPMGLTSLQLADSGAACRQIVSSWSETERETAERSLCMDYLFVPIYTTALAALSILAAHWFASKGLATMASIAIGMAWGQWVVGLFDIAENSALLRTLQLHPHVPDSLAQFTSWCARLKFLVIVMAVLSCIFAILSTLG